MCPMGLEPITTGFATREGIDCRQRLPLAITDPKGVKSQTGIEPA